MDASFWQLQLHNAAQQDSGCRCVELRGTKGIVIISYKWSCMCDRYSSEGTLGGPALWRQRELNSNLSCKAWLRNLGLLTAFFCKWAWCVMWDQTCKPPGMAPKIQRVFLCCPSMLSLLCYRQKQLNLLDFSNLLGDVSVFRIGLLFWLEACHLQRFEPTSRTQSTCKRLVNIDSEWFSTLLNTKANKTTRPKNTSKPFTTGSTRMANSYEKTVQLIHHQRNSQSKKTAFLGYNSHTLPLTYWSCIFQCFLVYSPSCTTITTINFRIFSPSTINSL